MMLLEKIKNNFLIIKKDEKEINDNILLFNKYKKNIRTMGIALTPTILPQAGKPTFSFNKKIDKIVTIIGAIKDKVNASARDIKEIA